MEDNLVSLGFDVAEFTPTQKIIYDGLLQVYTVAEKIDNLKISLNLDPSWKDLKDAIKAQGDEIKKLQQANLDYVKASQVVKKSQDDLSLSVKEHAKNIDQVAIIQAKSNALSSNTAENLAIEKQLLSDKNKELQQSVKLLISETGSIAEAKAAVAQLIAQRDKLNLSTQEGIQMQQAINAKIDQYNNFIKLNVSGQEQQKINVGNYSGALKILEQEVTNVNSRLELMAEQGQTSGAAFENLSLQSKLLNTFLEQNRQGFSSVTQELRTNERALFTLSAAGLENTEAFEKMRLAVAETKESLTDLKDQQKILATDVPAISALASAARGLGGAYALGAGASALFANGNEKVEKELQKLVAVMTLLQGLEEVIKAMKERGAIVVALQVTAQKALNAVRAIEITLFGEATAATELNTVASNVSSVATERGMEVTELNTTAVRSDTAATELNISAVVKDTAVTKISEAAVESHLATIELNTTATAQNTLTTLQDASAKNMLAVTEAEVTVAASESAAATIENAAAMEANIVTAEANSAAMAGTAAATEGATIATIGLRTALISTGIGAIVIGLIYGITKLVGFISDWANADEKAIKKEKELVSALKEQNEAIEKNIELINERFKDIIADADKENALVEAAGKNYQEKFAAQKKVYDLQKKQADEKLSAKIAQAEKEYSEAGVKGIDALDMAQSGHLTKYRNYNAQLVGLAESFKKNYDHLSKDERKTIEDRMSDMGKNADIEMKSATDIDKVKSEAFNADKALQVLGIANTKKYTDEQRELALFLAESKAGIAKEYDSLILADDKSTQAQKIAAIKRNASEEIKVAAATRASVVDDPASSDTAKTKAIRKEADDILIITLQSNEAQRKLNEEYRVRRLVAITDTQNSMLQTQEAFNEETLKKDGLTYKSKAAALSQNVDLELQIETNRYKIEKDKRGLTAEEVNKIDADHYLKRTAIKTKGEADLLKIQDEFIKKRLDEEARAAAGSIRAEEHSGKSTQTSRILELADAYDKLSNQLRDGTIDFAKFTREKEKLDNTFSTTGIQDQIDSLLKIRKIQRDNGESTVDTDNQVAALEQQLRERGVTAVMKTEAQKLEAKKAVADKEKELAFSTLDLLQTIATSQYENEKNRIQDLMALSDARYTKEIADIQASSFADDVKANKVKILEADQAAARLQYDEQIRQENIKKAKADRVFQIFQIVGNTAIGITSALAQFPPNPILAAIIGAIGAVQVAKVLATPIPKYAKGAGVNGRPLHPGGIAEYGEAGPEKIEEPGKAARYVDGRQTGYLAPDTRITPLTDDYVNESMHTGAMRLQASYLRMDTVKNDEAWRIARFLDKQNSKNIAKLIKRKIAVNLTIAGGASGSYVNNQYGR